MNEIQKALDIVIDEFGLKDFLLKPKREGIENIKLIKVPNPSFKKAEKLERNGKWKDAANHYYTLFIRSESPIQKAQAYILLSQMYISLVKYNLARKFLLDNKNNILTSLSGWDKRFYEAQILEKLGWINDYFGETKEAITNFSQARQLLINKAKEDDAVLRVYETSNHFLGRQYAILAWQGEDVQNNSAQAIERFQESVQIYQKLRAKGKPDDAAEGFQYGWMARMDTLQVQYQAVESDLKRMQELFAQALKERPGSGVMGHYYLLKGRLEFEQKNYQLSQDSFKEALRINTEVVNYPSSQADALLGMGLCDYFLDKKDKAKEEILKALSINPSLLYRGYI